MYVHVCARMHVLHSTMFDRTKFVSIVAREKILVCMRFNSWKSAMEFAIAIQ